MLDQYKDGALVETLQLSASKRVYKVGRQAGFADVVLAHASISREHATLTVSASGSVVVCDLGSAHGTSISGKRLPANKPHLLAPGRSLQFGASSRIFKLRADSTGFLTAAGGAASAPPPGRVPASTSRMNASVGSPCSSWSSRRLRSFSIERRRSRASDIRFCASSMRIVCSHPVPPSTRRSYACSPAAASASARACASVSSSSETTISRTDLTSRSARLDANLRHASPARCACSMNERSPTSHASSASHAASSRCALSSSSSCSARRALVAADSSAAVGGCSASSAVYAAMAPRRSPASSHTWISVSRFATRMHRSRLASVSTDVDCCCGSEFTPSSSGAAPGEYAAGESARRLRQRYRPAPATSTNDAPAPLRRRASMKIGAPAAGMSMREGFATAIATSSRSSK